MGLNDIKLPEFIISEWYGDSLLPAASQAPIKPAAPTTPLAASPTPVEQTPGLQTSGPQTPAAQTLPAQTVPAHTVPAQTLPAHTVSAQTLPAQTVSAQTLPAHTVPAQPSLPQTPAPFKFLGSNRRHIAILVNAPGTPFLPDNQLTFLTKILEACSMTLADVAIINNAATPTNIARIKEQLNPKTTLLFGIEPSTLRLPIHFPPFKPLDYDGCTYLSAPGMDQLVPNTEESKLLKSKLWVCLKTIFHV